MFRDWRGLAESARLDVPALAACSRISFASHCMHRWSAAGGTIAHFISALSDMDRHDVILDTLQDIGESFVYKAYASFIFNLICFIDSIEFTNL